MKEAEYNLVFFFSGIKRLSKYILLFHLFFIMFFSACGREQCGFKSSNGMSEDADLQSIILSAGSLVPPFSPIVTAYTVDLPMNVESIIITGIVNNQSAEISSNNGSVQRLEAGLNTILLTVTAENEKNIKYYQIMINRRTKEIFNNAGN